MMLHSCSDWFGRQINVSKRPVPPPLLLPALLFVFLAKNLFYLCASDHTQRALIFDPFFICLVLACFRSIPLLVAATVVAELHQLLGRNQVRLGEGLLGALMMMMMMMINIATWWRRTRRRWCFCRHWNTTCTLPNSQLDQLIFVSVFWSPPPPPPPKSQLDLYGFGGCFFCLKCVLA